MKTQLQIMLAVTVGAALMLGGCGGAGVKQDSGGGGGVASTLDGSIQSSTGGSSDFEGWTIALVDQATGESRISEIDALGAYSFNQVDTDSSYTMVLLNADYRIASILSMVAADLPGKVYQWFEPTSSNLPRLIHKGPAMEFSNPDAVTILTQVAEDSDSDGIPDGMEASSSSSSLNLTEDTDEDGVDNGTDADIDGDGLPNWFDEDDDGNGTIDVFDLDANSDVVLDSSQKIGDHYFGEEIEYVAVQIFSAPDSVMKAKFTVKLSDLADSPTLVSVSGSSDLFDEARIYKKGETGGEEVSDIWDRSLLDDGNSFDDSAGDDIYSRKVKLKTGNIPSAKQVVFISVNYGTYTREFPFTFPTITLDEFGFSYSTANKRITKSGEPFGEDEESYVWSVHVFDDEGNLMHSSEQLEGAANTYNVPEEDIADSNITYAAKVYAYSLERVSGYPVFVIESAQEDLD